MFITIVYHYRTVRASFSYMVEDILAGKISRENLGCGGLDDSFRVTKGELGISAVSKQTKKNQTPR